MSGALANFTCLDELTQVIYQGISKFVVLSTVSDDKWDIYLGLAKSKGRWWHGFWTEKDVHHNFGPKSSDKILEAFAEKLAELFIQGQICVTDWSPEKGANIKFTLGPTANRPTHVDLVEMSSEDAAAHATTVFVEIALQAQSRKCRLYTSSTEYQLLDSKPRVSHPASATTRLAAGPSKRKERTPEPEPEEETAPKSGVKVVAAANEPAKEKAAQREIESLKSRLKQTTSQAPAPSARTSATPVPAQKPTPSVRPSKGTSLANPNKKARKYQAIEFGSDDE
ncbi:hypothetical protein D9619_001733 [Psilocybe cf. subviscida]|uniref:Uncharacterized protein n=1 Tax=Psilocybe cf. subviscida TaxID=2480587 RepID=A0A8H5BIH3_9AGAR|nr:hypothetical protein D9619_001733 [Psilocybe cf. subviscida]